MCAHESQGDTLPSQDERIVSTAEEGLATLLKSDDVSPEQISCTLEALSKLKKHIATARERRADLSRRTERYSAAIIATQNHQERLDRDIIEAKMQVGELLSTKDSVARDLARAKRELQKLEEPVELPSSGTTAISSEALRSLNHDSVNSPHDRLRSRGSASVSGPTAGKTADGRIEVDKRDILEEEDVDVLTNCVAQEMERLQIAEKELVDVVDEINSTKKRRAELQEKMKAAQEEW